MSVFGFGAQTIGWISINFGMALWVTSKNLFWVDPARKV